MNTVHFLVAYWGDPDFLDAAVASVISQTDDRWLLTIVDDAYPGGRARDRYADHPDHRIEYLRNEVNLGVAGNFERCRTLARGDLVVFLGSDDLLRPDFVACARSSAATTDWTILQLGVEVIDDDGRPARTLTDRVKAWLAPNRPTTLRGEPLAISLLRGNWLYWPSLVFRRGALDRHAFRQDLPIILDLALIMELVLDGASLSVRDDPVFAYRRHSASASSVSLLEGERLADERRFLREMAHRLRDHGWRRAARVCRWRVVSRLQGLASLPTAVVLSVRRQTWEPLKLVAANAFLR
ncbi:MAG: glycosyltransferase [Aeromicrobium sp.]